MKKSNIAIHAANLIILISVLAIGNLLYDNFAMMISFYISAFGFLALVYIIFILSIPLLIKIKKNMFTILLLSNRRIFGIYTFVFASIHVFLVFNYFFEWSVKRILNSMKNLYLFFGVAAFLILAAMAITSNDFAVRVLKKNWKRLHYLIYVALILILLHSINLGSNIMSNYLIKIVVIVLAIAIIAIKILLRLVEKSK
ncbi:MAG: ferric reductase-like transmembrane domain-containing protein [Candidatus Aenigmatarchaeota archaeon]